jgi:hypothetical protein
VAENFDAKRLAYVIAASIQSQASRKYLRNGPGYDAFPIFFQIKYNDQFASHCAFKQMNKLLIPLSSAGDFLRRGSAGLGINRVQNPRIGRRRPGVAIACQIAA